MTADVPVKKSLKLVKYDITEHSDEEAEDSETIGADTVALPPLKHLASTAELTPAEKFNAFKKKRVAKKMEGEMSQTVVDDFFKDFLANKLKQINEDYKERDKKKESGAGPSMEEMNKLLDAEIIQLTTVISDDTSQTPNNLQKDKTKTGSTNIPTGFKPVQEKEAPSNSKPSQGSAEVSKDNPGPVEGAVTAAEDKITSGIVKTEAKKIGFKNFGIKLSITSAELIQSGEIHKKGKRLEDGEVLSSHSEESGTESEEDESDKEVSGTGSLSDSDKDEKTSKAKKKKKKKKHKHKKKKKHKDKDKERKDKGESKEKSSKRKNSHRSQSRSHSPKKSKRSHSSRSRSRERSQRRRSRSRSRSRDRLWQSKYGDFDAYLYLEKDRLKRESSWRDRRRSRSRSRSRRRSRSRSRSRDRDRNRTRDRDRERHTDKDREKERSDKMLEDLRLKIDKSKLREIAIKNAIANAKSGTGPSLDVTLKAGGRSVEELTDFCKRISSKDKTKGQFDLSSSSEEEGPVTKSDDEDAFIHHPFKVKEASIVMDIRNARQIPIITPGERLAQASTLRIQFPVSSGSQHRIKEWVPVEKSDPAAKPASTATAPKSSSSTSATTTTTTNTTTMPAPPVPHAMLTQHGVTPLAPPIPTAPVAPQDKVFEDPPAQSIDIGSIISERLQAVRKLQENPLDMSAKHVLTQAQKQASLWAQSKNLPGQFMGSTGANILSKDELIGPNKRNQAWAKKEQLINAAPISGGIGQFLLEKMGWKQGTGLGKNNEGSVEPLMLDVKIDRKGLTSLGEGSRRTGGSVPIVRAPTVKDLSGKHPVSALVELCNKRKWLPPDFEVVFESGPAHKKNFLVKVKINGSEYQPAITSNNKKLAKAEAATACLQSLGLVPR